jgi:hypothetical protein
MTVRQIIQEIETLSPEEQREVLLRFKEKSPEYSNTVTPTIRYVSKEEAKRISKDIFDEYADLFRKLAQ